jgi:hypothetical protein
VRRLPISPRPMADSVAGCLTLRVRPRRHAGRISYVYHLPDAKSRLVPFGPLRAARVATYTQFRQRKSATLAAEGPVYPLMSGGRRRSPVISEMFGELVSSPGRAVTAGVKPPSAHHLRRGFPVVTPFPWCGERIDPGVRPVHPAVFSRGVESASSVLCLTIAGDLPQPAGHRADRFGTPRSRDSLP